MNISPKKTCDWPTGTRKGVQHHQLPVPAQAGVWNTRKTATAGQDVGEAAAPQ